jgi:hypothetical protein
MRARLRAGEAGRQKVPDSKAEWEYGQIEYAVVASKFKARPRAARWRHVEAAGPCRPPTRDGDPI